MPSIGNRIGVIGLGDMGSGMAANLVKAGFEVTGCDRNAPKCAGLQALGGQAVAAVADAGQGADAVIVIVMNGAQAQAVAQELAAVMPKGASVILCSTIRPAEAREIAALLAEAGIGMVDSPVTGGRPGAQSGTLTLMAAASDEELERCRPVMEAISAKIYRVGTEAGQGQTAKACLQTLTGSVIAAACEAAALVARAGLSGEVFHQIASNSAAGRMSIGESLGNIIDRRFNGTGSHIDTLLKDLIISNDLAREQGVPLHMASTALQLVQAAKTKYVDCDNWAVARLGEEIAGVELHRSGPVWKA
jgi:3-hydroxyisobutyrate dehydrogenase-like beta-hydroxyacid dehydrogenase